MLGLRRGCNAALCRLCGPVPSRRYKGHTGLAPDSRESVLSRSQAGGGTTPGSSLQHPPPHHSLTTCQDTLSAFRIAFPFDISTIMVMRIFNPHFTGKETEAQGDEVACPRLQRPRTQVGVTQAHTRRRKNSQPLAPNLVLPWAQHKSARH